MKLRGRGGGGFDDRLRRLDEIVELGIGRLPEPIEERAAAMHESATARLGHGTDHTVVALAGATGSGKSSTFNAIVGEPLADVGVRRPTTSKAQAATVGGGADALLDWLDIPRRHVVGDRDDELAGLVLVDLPDHDSVAEAHRAEVDRLVEVVDVFVWVVDPQKYADAALHEQYLRRFAAHAAVTLVVLNQADRLDPTDRSATLDHLNRLLVADGLTGVRVLAASATTGAGIDELRRELVARVAERRAMVSRLDADLDWLADELAVCVGDVEPEPVPDDAIRRLDRNLAQAAGADDVAAASAAAHRHRSARVVGWPPTAWIGRLRPDPLRRLGLDRPTTGGADDDTVTVPVTNRGGPDAVSEARVADSLRAVVDRTTSGLPELWRRRVAGLADHARSALPDALDRAVSTVELPTAAPRWWVVISSMQRVLAAVMVVGLVWLVALGAVAWFGLPDLPTPMIGRLPWPTALALGGGLLGLLLAAVGRFVARMGAQRRAAEARRRIERAVADVGEQLVVRPIDAELAALSRLGSLARGLRR